SRKMPYWFKDMAAHREWEDACGRGCMETVRRMVKKKQSPEDGLIAACACGNLEILKYLVEQFFESGNADNHRDDALCIDKHWLLCAASIKGHLDIVKYF